MAGILDRVKFTPTLGGTTDWTVSAALPGFQTPASAGVVSGRLYRYVAETPDLTQWEIGEGIYSGGVLLRTRVRFNSSGGTSKINFAVIPRVAIVALAEDWTQSTSPQGKLTLASGTGTMRSTINGATSVLYTNVGSGTVPITMDGGNTFTDYTYAEMTQALTDATKSPAAAQPNAIYDYYLWDDAGTLRCTRSDYWKKAATVTMTIASPCVVTWTGNDFDEGTPIVFTTSGALPTGLTAGTTYYVKQTTPGTIANTFNVAATVGGAAINTSGTQSGTHTGTAVDKTGAVARAASGNCELDTAKRWAVNKNAITNGPAAGYGTFVGTVMTNSSGTVDQQFCSSASAFGAGWFGVWNCYNKERVGTKLANDSAGTFSSTNNTMARLHNSDNARFTFVRGLDVDMVEAEGNLYGVPGASTAMVAVWGLDSISSIATGCSPGWNNSGVSNQMMPTYRGLPGLGRHFLCVNTQNSTTTASNWRSTDSTAGGLFGFQGFLWL